jgi:putative transposase
VISDSHAGLIKAVQATMQGASWQRCRAHVMRNALARVGKGEAEMVAATIRTIFAQPGQGEVRAQVDAVADMLTGRFPAVAALLTSAKADLTAFADFPRPHWQKIWSTNPIERLNREVKRRTDVVGIFPDPDALLRLSACVLIEAHDEWLERDRRYLSEESMALLTPPEPTPITTKTTPAAPTHTKTLTATA